MRANQGNMMKKTNDLPYSAFVPETRQTIKAKLFSKDEMNAIWDYLEQSGTLRDRCLYAFMMSGMRAIDYLEATPENIESSFRLPEGNAYSESLYKYIESKKLGAGDYLFPSTGCAGVPLSTAQLKKIFDSWLLKAGLGNENRTPHTIRASIQRQI
jgi:integrase